MKNKKTKTKNRISNKDGYLKAKKLLL